MIFIKALRWLGFLPAFIVAGALLKVAWWAGMWAMCWAFHWLNWITDLDLPDSQEFAAFFRANDMHGTYWSGTMWLLLSNVIAWSVAVQAAAITAPAFKLQAVRILALTLCAIMVVGIALLAYIGENHTFSYWWRTLADSGSLGVGLWYGVSSVRESSQQKFSAQ